MSRRDSSPPLPALVPTDSKAKIATISRHNSVTSAQDLEIVGLKRQIKDLQAVQTGPTWNHDQLSQELKACKSDLAKEKQESRTFAGKLSRERRNASALNQDMVKLRKDTERKVRDIETKLDYERKKRAKNEQDANQSIAELQSQLDAKHSVVQKVAARVPHGPSPMQVSIIPKLHSTIKNLQAENTRLQNIHHKEGCEEYQNFILEQLEDARDLQAAAEAETEGLRHLAKANAGLADERGNDVKYIKELIQERDDYCNEADQVLAIQVANPASPTAENNNTEIAEYWHLLRAAELEIEHLTSKNERLASEFDLASSNKSALARSDLQTVSTTPCTPGSASALITDPILLTELQELGTSIMSLSTVPPAKTKLHATPLLPNIALTINIQPTDKRNYSLLQRVQSAISGSSSLDIHGPKEVVKQFVASMHDVERDHAEKSKLVVQLDKAAKQHRADLEVAEIQLRDKRKCLDPEHRTMADELEAKNVQFAMQAQLLASWEKRNG